RLEPSLSPLSFSAPLRSKLDCSLDILQRSEWSMNSLQARSIWVDKEHISPTKEMLCSADTQNGTTICFTRQTEGETSGEIRFDISFQKFDAWPLSRRDDVNPSSPSLLSE